MAPDPGMRERRTGDVTSDSGRLVPADPLAVDFAKAREAKILAERRAGHPGQAGAHEALGHPDKARVLRLGDLEIPLELFTLGLDRPARMQRPELRLADAHAERFVAGLPLFLSELLESADIVRLLERDLL